MNSSNPTAIDYIETYVKNKYPNSKEWINRLCQQTAIDRPLLETLLNHIKTKASICFHFHPYRLNDKGENSITSLLEIGIYKNQFETKISNGSLSAYKGGDRDNWENNLFGQLFADEAFPLSHRPKYGALDLLRHSAGPSPRFGSCYFVLEPIFTQNATFTYLDSYRTPDERGTLQVFDVILAGMLEDCIKHGEALGEMSITPNQLVDRIIESLSTPYSRSILQAPEGNLDQYIEAQVHGEILLKNAVSFLIADIGYKHTPFATSLLELCEKYEIELDWHPGFELTVTEAIHNFRGTEMPAIATQLAVDDKINVAVLAATERVLTKDFKDKKILNYKLQQLKYLWHTLVQFGKPIQHD